MTQVVEIMKKESIHLHNFVLENCCTLNMSKETQRKEKEDISNIFLSTPLTAPQRPNCGLFRVVILIKQASMYSALVKELVQ